MRELRRLGLRVLMNEHVVVRRGDAALVVAGVTDFGAGHFDRAAGERSGARRSPAARRRPLRVLLAHQPRSAEAAEAAGFDLQLSGHTHGGQFLPWNLFVRLQQPFTAGLHRWRRMWVYTSRGTGYWGPPKRFGAPSEITLLRLVAAPAPRPRHAGRRLARRRRPAGRLSDAGALQFAGFGRRPPAAHREESTRVHFRSFRAGRSRGHRRADGPFGALGGLGGMLPLVLMFVVLYFVMIRPQMKRQKEHKAMIDALAKGDEVVTSGGVLGKVSKMGDTFVGVEVANGVEIQVQRSAVVQVMPKGTVK